MFKKLVLVSALTLSTALGGCAGLTPANLAADVAAIEAQVQADTNLVCGFIPTVATIAAFIPGSGAIVAGASSIAQSICAAIAAAPPVTAQKARLKSLGNNMAVNVATVRVPGAGLVPISGTFTR